MPAPFYNAIKGTTAGTPGTGAFTPNAASPGFRPWSTVPTGWIGLVRYEDGSAWELTYSCWNGATLSRASTQIPHNSDGTLQTSSGSQLTLTSAATAAMIVDAGDVMSHVGVTPWHVAVAVSGATTVNMVGLGSINATGTAAGTAIANTNALTEQPSVQYSSVTTANARSGWGISQTYVLSSTAAGRGGFEFVGRFGASQLPTGPQLFVGVSSSSWQASTAEPSAVVGNVAVFGKDSTDTNIQLITNDNSGGGGKTDTGIALVANGVYEASVWAEPGGGRVYGLLIRLDTGAIWTGSTATNLPGNGAAMGGGIIGGVNGTNTGTAFIMLCILMSMRNGI